MQLELTTEVEGEEEQQGRTVVNDGGRRKGKGKGPRSEQSESHAYESCLCLLSLSMPMQRFDLNISDFTTSASSRQPLLPLVPSYPDAEIDRLDGSNGSSTEDETEEEWLDTSQLAELTCRFPSRMSEAMAIEVCSYHSLHLHVHSLLFSGHCGMIRPIWLAPALLMQVLVA